ncbi:hypothetical protein NPIL_498771 [Nephila pilipes]|uniref:Uncharacterized protein n=1 Tax=Nephila pilipes TaxID=299642 RepID=A0A8X6Q9H0_NEPPI|nr:hypothetical protein NPIL_498771 [Nephila pilipes]
MIQTTLAEETVAKSISRNPFDPSNRHDENGAPVQCASEFSRHSQSEQSLYVKSDDIFGEFDSFTDAHRLSFGHGSSLE